MSRVLPIGLLALTSCDRSDPNICGTMLPQWTKPIENVFDQRSAMAACEMRWSYRLARSKGDARMIATAVANGCDDAVSATAALASKADRESGITPEPYDDRYARERNDFIKMALFHVVQARAGHCAIPK